MKSVVISVIITCIIISGSLIYTKNLEKISDELTGINERVIECIETGDYLGADAEIDRLSAYLKSRQTLLDATGNHEEIDKIEMNLYELAEYTRGQNKTDALSRCHVLDFLFKRLPLNYKLKPENIL